MGYHAQTIIKILPKCGLPKSLWETLSFENSYESRFATHLGNWNFLQIIKSNFETGSRRS